MLRQDMSIELSTARLKLVPPTAEDLDACHGLLSHPETSKFSDMPRGPSRKRSLGFLNWMMRLNASGKGAAWCLKDGDDAHIGHVRFNTIAKKSGTAVLGYEVLPAMWGQGFASEAVLEVVRFGHVALALRRIEAWTHPDNNASQRVLEKAGFVYEGRQRAKILMGES